MDLPFNIRVSNRRDKGPLLRFRPPEDNMVAIPTRRHHNAPITDT